MGCLSTATHLVGPGLPWILDLYYNHMLEQKAVPVDGCRVLNTAAHAPMLRDAHRLTRCCSDVYLHIEFVRYPSRPTMLCL